MIQTTIDEFPWLTDLPPSAAWCWVAFHHHVAKHGQPAGVVPRHTPAKWATTLGVAVADFTTMIGVAKSIRAVAIRTATYKIESLATPSSLAPSTLRMRRHRAKKRGEEKPRQDQPFWTMKDARAITKEHREAGNKCPKALGHAILAALALLGDHDEPFQFILAAIDGQPSPIDALNNAVSEHVGHHVELTEQ